MDPDRGRHEWGDRGRKRTVITGCLVVCGIGAIIWLIALGMIWYFFLRS
ncbi:hypothetical protein AB0L53_51450 [Nonomuraea sp. NPDC052129]